MLNKSVFVYLEDILILSCSETKHVTHVHAVLQYLLQNHLYAKEKKCEFHVPTVSFLGFIISAGSIKMDPAKAQAFLVQP